MSNRYQPHTQQFLRSPLQTNSQARTRCRAAIEKVGSNCLLLGRAWHSYWFDCIIDRMLEQQGKQKRVSRTKKKKSESKGSGWEYILGRIREFFSGPLGLLWRRGWASRRRGYVVDVREGRMLSTEVWLTYLTFEMSEREKISEWFGWCIYLRFTLISGIALAILV